MRLPDLPDVPMAKEAGLDLKGFRERNWFGLLAPRGSPTEVLERISQEAAKAAAEPDLRTRLLGVAQIADHQTQAQFARQVGEDRVYFAGLIKELDIKLE